MRKITLLSFLFIIAGCTSQKTRDPKQLETGLDQTMQICEERIAKARQDLSETKARLQTLGDARNPKLHGRVTELEETLEKVKPERAKLLSAKSEIASLIYNRSELKATDANAGKVDEALRSFYAASDAIQRTVSDYAMKSSDLDEYLHAEKLYRTFHPAEFQSAVRARIDSAQEEARQMQADLSVVRAKMTDNRTPSSSSFSEMEDFAQKYVERANRLSGLSRDMSFATADAKQISNLDSGWEKAQKLRADFSALEAELDKLSSGFNAAKAKF